MARLPEGFCRSLLKHDRHCEIEAKIQLADSNLSPVNSLHYAAREEYMPTLVVGSGRPGHRGVHTIGSALG